MIPKLNPQCSKFVFHFSVRLFALRGVNMPKVGADFREVDVFKPLGVSMLGIIRATVPVPPKGTPAAVMES